MYMYMYSLLPACDSVSFLSTSYYCFTPSPPNGRLYIPSSGDLRVKCLGTHHQKSIYMIWPPNAPSNTQYDYISLFHIAYSHIYLLGSAGAVFFGPYLVF